MYSSSSLSSNSSLPPTSLSMSMSLTTSRDDDGHDDINIDGLPVEIQESIVRRLSLGDRFRISAVSKSWRQLITSTDQDLDRNRTEIPWIFLPKSSSADAKEKSKTISFFSMSDDRVYGGFNVPEPICITPLGRGWCCCGSSRGWLLLSNNADYDLRMNLMLLNPISGATLQLPDLMTIPFSYEFREGLPRGTNFSLAMIKRIAVSSPAEDNYNSSQLLVAAIFRSDHEDCDVGILGICRPNVDCEWTMFGESDLGTLQFPYGDILFHHGKLFVQLIGYAKGDKETMDNYITTDAVFLDADCEVRLEFRGILAPDQDILDHSSTDADDNQEDHMTDGDPHEEVLYTYLVESIHGELLSVKQSVETSQSKLRTWAAQLLGGCGELDYKTMNFEVRKEVGSSGGDDHDSQPDQPILDDQVIFLASTGGSTCVAARNLLDSPFKGNCIYFISSFAPEFQSRVQLGIFDLKEKRIEFRPIPGKIGKMPLVPTCWFTPMHGGDKIQLLDIAADSDAYVDYSSMYGGWYNTYDYLMCSELAQFVFLILSFIVGSYWLKVVGFCRFELGPWNPMRFLQLFCNR